jgi:quercetin dioxygenase-like cupin family protein
LECHISTLNPSRASHPPHTHPQEELIILRDGTLDVNANGTMQRVGPGSLFFFRSNNPHNVQNNGDKPATYFVFNFATAATRTPPAIGAPVGPGQLGSVVIEWGKLSVQATKTGERRGVLDSPTATLANFECHVTTINAGESPHAPHRHPDEEIILVKEGLLDVTIKGVTQRAGPGAICFFSSNDEHGLRNAGDRRATYYVIRLVTAATPKRVVAN